MFHFTRTVISVIILIFIHTQSCLPSVNSAFSPILGQLETLSTLISLRCPMVSCIPSSTDRSASKISWGSTWLVAYRGLFELLLMQNRMQIPIQSNERINMTCSWHYTCSQAPRSIEIIEKLCHHCCSHTSQPASGRISFPHCSSCTWQGSVQGSGKFVASNPYSREM